MTLNMKRKLRNTTESCDENSDSNDSNNDLVSDNKRLRRSAKDKAIEINKLFLLETTYAPKKTNNNNNNNNNNSKKGTDLTVKNIERLYTINKLEKFRPTPLETIIEVPEEIEETEEQELPKRIFGTRKVRRAITFSQGIIANKQTQRQRRNRIKKYFGRIPRVCKINMIKFLERLGGNHEPIDVIVAKEHLDSDLPQTNEQEIAEIKNGTTAGIEVATSSSTIQTS